MAHIASRAASTLLAACTLSAVALAGSLSSPNHDVSSGNYRLVIEDKPTNAAKIFRWGLSAWEDEFRPEVHFSSRRWASSNPARVGQQIGMLTLKAPSNPIHLETTATDHWARFGRWEARMRTRVYDKGHSPYHVFFELIPVGEYRCGAKSLVVASYYPGRPMVDGYARTKPNNEFHFSTNPEATTEEFHTFAIEITRRHISWFVDKKVLMTERRPEALSHVRYKVRFRMEGNPQVNNVMNESWLQMDWVRYYTLDRPNAKPITAPPAQKTVYNGGCWPTP